MKKFLALILAAIMIFAVVSCGSANDDGKDTDANVTDTEATDTEATGTEANDTEATDTEATDTEANDTEANDTEANDTEASNGDSADLTWGQTLLGVFKDAIAANPAITAEELANTVISHESILFMKGTMPMEAGAEWIPGFDTAPTGWKECVNFGPMIGSIAFVGYIFTLEEGADVDAFKAELKANANPGWNICVTADETVVENVGNTVFFLMCPSSNGSNN